MTQSLHSSPAFQDEWASRARFFEDQELHEVRLCLLGGFELFHRKTAVALPMSAQRLVGFLALRGRPVLRAQVAGMLWPETTDDKAHANLRSALWRVRSVGLALVETAGNHLKIGKNVTVDFNLIMERARRLIEGEPAELDTDFQLTLRAGDLLPDWYEDWAVMEGERLRQLRLHALEVLCDRLADAKQYGRAVEAGVVAVAAEPLRESAHRALIRAYRQEGNAWEAIRQYHRYRELLHSSLGLQPSSLMEAAVEGLGIK